MAANYLLGYKPKPHCLNLTSLPPKPFLIKSNQLHYFTTNNKTRVFSFSYIITQPTKSRSTSLIDFKYSNQPPKALAAGANSFLQVSDEVDDNESKLAIKSFRISKELLLEKGKMAAEFLVWIPLAFSSVFALPAAIVAAFLFGVIDGAAGDEVMGFVRYALINLLCKNFIGNIFSVAFGDGGPTPSQDIEETKWKMIGKYIALNGGVVTAEEIAPYLDPKATKKKDGGSYMRPVLLRFDGQPIIDGEGNILYHFPSLQCFGKCWDTEVENFLKEEEWPFSKVSAKGIEFMNYVLGYNLFSAIIVSELLRRIDGSALFMLINGYFCVPLLRVYVMFASSFFVIQFIREAYVKSTNIDITRRNDVREWHAKGLEKSDHSLKRKLLSARAMAGRISIDDDKFLFRSERDLYELHASEKLEWDRRFKDRCDSVPGYIK